ncbi:hypothetical protein NQ315_001544 [Exocentrus adspersus]|uniref:RNB domain-containing protein n=1 Tax=Exocentrus adspersus TaxID=1586481 RepID=A0AAV8W8Q4_9CUCU|nr:hypothetical protein NQ315_001544 [Exocentrus adspersus]
MASTSKDSGRLRLDELSVVSKFYAQGQRAEHRNSMEVQWLEAQTSTVTVRYKDEKAKGTRRKPRNKTPKQAQAGDSAVKVTKIHVAQSNYEGALHQPKPSTSKSVPVTASPKPGSSTPTRKSTTPTTGGTPTRKPVPNHVKEVEVKYSFVIKPVTSPDTGYFLKRRNSKYKYVNLKSFLTDLDQVPCVFTSELGSATVPDKQEKSPVLANQTKEMSKSQSRKYQLQTEPTTSTKRLRRKKKEKKSKQAEVTKFDGYMDAEAVAKGLKTGELIKGYVRINPKNFRDAYVSNEDTSLGDYYLTSVADRNRALEGDEVALQIKPETEWTDGKKTAVVVHILKPVHSRISIGVLKPMEKRNSEFAVFYPRDKRMPILRIPAICWPNGFKTNPKQYEKMLFVAKITNWNVPSYALGVLTENLGMSGDLAVESMSILREFDLDVTPFSADILQDLPRTEEIPQKELEYREDIRKQCVFTIDPPTARDLDDAVSVLELENGNYEIGVHISDASYYLEEGTELDQLVSKKATTVYLVEKAYHMLPVELCLHCSLLPGKDRLSFSVFWEMTPEGDVITKRFARTIMNSCVQLSYDHAQAFIDDPDKECKPEDFPNIHNGFTVADLKKTVLVLQGIARKLRERRVQNGALKIDQVKLSFELDPKTGEPLEFWKYENKEAHRLIEDFMLLANITVAERISEAFPDIAFLRCHEPPKQTMLVELQNNLATCGIHIDISSSGGMNASMKKYITEDYAGQCRGAVLNHITAKAMTRARYFCSATMESELDYKHYALSVQIYTHFTSPIRRYADIMVHRLLAASLGYCDKPEWDEAYVSEIAANCNAQKYNAKKAGEASCDLYLAHYVEKHQPFEQDCVVVDVKDRSFDVIVLRTGSVIRLYQNSCEENAIWQTEAIPVVKDNVSEDNAKKPKGENEKKLYRLKVTFPKTDHFPESVLIVEMFSIVKVNLTRLNSYKLEATLLRPIATLSFTRQ